MRERERKKERVRERGEYARERVIVRESVCKEIKERMLWRNSKRFF